jgi:hypothetical protein
MVTLDESNKIMIVVNKYADIINEKTREFDKKRMHKKDAHLIFKGLRFANIKYAEFMSELEPILLNEQDEKINEKNIINNMIHYCDENIIEILKLEKILKPYESMNKIRINQLMLVREFLYEYKKNYT